MVKKKHKTPDHLDYMFQRNVIYKSQYADFWEGYWDAVNNRRSEQRYIDSYVSRNQLEIPFKKRSRSGTITFSRAAAEEQAKNIGGYVIRVTKTGRRSKHGRFYRAIAPRKRKKK
jgi:hypothetical protein